MSGFGYAGALVGGVLTLLSPCSVMLLPAFFAYAFTSPAKLLARTGVFYLGLVATLVPVGMLAGTLGAFLMQNRGAFVTVAASIIILLGIVQISGIPLPGFTRSGAAEGTSIASVFLLGAIYGVAGVCAGPILGSVLMVAAVGGNAVYGGIMLAIYALGMAVPLFVLALVWDKLRIAERGWLRPRTLRIGRWKNSWLMIISGILAIGIGTLLIVTEGTASLGGILTVDAQAATENWVVGATAGVSNLVFGLGALVLIAVVAGLYWMRRRSTTVTADTSPTPAPDAHLSPTSAEGKKLSDPRDTVEA